MKYRPEIDGLRAIAVLPVIFFHAGFDSFGGGFVGVDVFFVISGYLITSIIIAEMEDGRFSLTNFYARRARRILPALICVVLCCIPVAWVLLLPKDMEEFASSLVAVATFSSNIHFWRESGYFATAAELKPLLHTWSLAVEEQFYILFPIFLIGIWRLGRRPVVGILLLIFAISLGLAHWQASINPSAAFYLLPTRGWELLMGSLVAFYLHRRPVAAPAWANQVFSAIGLVAILVPVFVFDKTVPFPSLYALLPDTGTVLLILFARRGTVVQAALSAKPVVGLGLISYSLYLWHQPIFAFARHRVVLELSVGSYIGLAGLALVLALLTYRFVEQPFRRGPYFRLGKRRAFLLLIPLVLLGGFGAVGWFEDGWPARFGEDVQRFIRAAEDRSDGTCDFGEYKVFPAHPLDMCLSEGRTEAMIIGDSHSRALSYELTRELARRGIGNYNVSYSGCIPIPGLHRGDLGPADRCPGFLRQALDYARDSGIGTLVLTARFPMYLTGARFDNGQGGVETGEPIYVDVDGFSAAWDDPERQRRVLKAYEDGLKQLSEHFDVVLVDPIPEAGWNVPQMGAMQAIRGEGVSLTTRLERYLDRSREILSLFNRLVLEDDRFYGVHTHEAFCDAKQGVCLNADSDGVYYFDDDHPSNAGARRVAPAIADAVERTLQ